MTREEAVAKARSILDDIAEHEIECRDYDDATEFYMRQRLEEWKAEQIAEIERRMIAMARSMLN